MPLNAPPTITTRRALLCRACGSATLRPVFSLGAQPLANRYLSESTLTAPEPRIPLTLQRCAHCTLLQLTHIVAPEALYAEYKFASGVSLGWQRHCAALLDGRASGRLLDLASNDGTLVRVARTLGWDALGVEPTPLGEYPVVRGYWPEAAAQLPQGKYDLVVAQNVFGHVDDALAFLHAVREVLAPNGRCVIECPDAVAMLSRGQYDQIYHEHLSYWSLLPLWTLAVRARLDIVEIEELPIHGGSLRYWLSHSSDPTPPSYAVTKRLQAEQVLRKPNQARRFAINANVALTACTNELLRLAEAGQRVWACGASAKSSVVLNALAARYAPMPECVLDDSPLKQGLFTPGTHLPIVPFQDLSHVNALLLTAWNWADAMKARAREFGFTGRFVMPHA